MGVEYRAGRGSWHPVNAAREVTKEPVRGKNLYWEVLVGGRSCMVDILAGHRMNSVWLRDTTCGVGGS